MHIVVTGKSDTSVATVDAVTNMKNGNVKLVVAESVAKILDACEAVTNPADPVTRIDIVGHGAPGYVALANDGTEALSCTRGDVLNVAKLVQVLDGQQPMLRLVGCNTALHGDRPGTDGPVLLAWLAHAMPGVRIVGTRCEFQSDAFGPNGLELEEAFLYSIVHGDKVETTPDAMTLPEDIDPVDSPVNAGFLEAAATPAPQATVAGWLAQAREARCVDATRLLTAFREVQAFTTGSRKWRVGFTRAGARLMIEDDNGQRFLFPTVSIPASERPPDDP